MATWVANRIDVEDHQGIITFKTTTAGLITHQGAAGLLLPSVLRRPNASDETSLAGSFQRLFLTGTREGKIGKSNAVGACSIVRSPVFRRYHESFEGFRMRNPPAQGKA